MSALRQLEQDLRAFDALLNAHQPATPARSTRSSTPTSRRAERAAHAAELRAQGRMIGEIATELGIGRSYASSLLCDPTGAIERERKKRYQGTCERCGAPTSGGDGRAKAPKHCAPCSRQLQRERAKWTRETVIAAIQAFAEKYGRPPSSTDWNPAHARHLGHHEKAARFHEDGCWPTSNTVRLLFGLWADAIETAGYRRPRIGDYLRQRNAA